MRRNDKRSGRDSEPTDFSKYSSFNKNRSFNKGGLNPVPREMHKAKCADCGKECDVPFKPKEGRPVYCKECYAKHKPRGF